MTDILSNLKVGDRIKFAEERMSYTVKAVGPRYIVCTKPFNPRRTVLYTVVDRVDRVRGTENVVFGMGFETDEQCADAIDRLEGVDPNFQTGVSHRNRIPLRVERVIPA